MIKTLLVLMSFVVGYMTANDSTIFRRGGLHGFTTQLSYAYKEVNRDIRYMNLVTKGNMRKVTALQTQMMASLQNTSSSLRNIRSLNDTKQIFVPGSF